MGNDNDELLAQARRGVGRAAGELEQVGRGLGRPWPRVPAEVLAEGQAAVGRAAAALRTLSERLGEPPGVPESSPDSRPS